MSGSNILFILSGSIACYKACEAISQLVQRGHRVRAVATPAALRFVGVATLEGLTRGKVATELFAEGAALDHIELTRWANITVVCPATANLLNRIAAGLADDLAGALLLAHNRKTPLLVVPAMNPAMWQHPATAASVEKLRAWDVRFVAVGSGRTACGEVGEGRLAEPEEIVSAIELALRRPERRLRVLVTSGGTVEPIDGVRVIANTSTGKTGTLIAGTFVEHGHDVVLLRATNAPRANGAQDETFRTFQQLDTALQRLLAEREFDAVIHAAAVSDFSIQKVEIDGRPLPSDCDKLPSDAAPVLFLKRNHKLLDTLRARSRNPMIRVVAFKLTQNASIEAVRSNIQPYFERGVADFVVHNDLSWQQENGIFPAAIWKSDGAQIENCPDRPTLAARLEQILLQITAAGP